MRRRREREGEREAREVIRLEADVAESVRGQPSERIAPIVAVRLARCWREAPSRNGSRWEGQPRLAGQFAGEGGNGESSLAARRTREGRKYKRQLCAARNEQLFLPPPPRPSRPQSLAIKRALRPFRGLCW